MEQLIWFIVMTLVSVALAPKPRAPRPAALEDFSLPVAEEGRPIPVAFGEVEITGANVLWYGDLSTRKIKKSSLFSSQTIGYRYNLGMHLGLCHGPVDAFLRFRAGEKTAWAGSVTDNGTITVDDDELFGGRDREGGMQGVLEIAFGDWAQSASSYLAATIPHPIGASRGVLSLVWRNGEGDGGGYVGNSSYLPPWSFRVRRILAGWHGDPWYPTRATINTRLMNPAHIVYECLTNPEWGLGWSTAIINDAQWRAAADTLYGEGLGLAMLWAQTETIENFIQIVLDHIDGILAFRPSTGQFELVLVRQDYDVESLPIVNTANLRAVEGFQRQAWGETINELTLVYVDHETGKDTSITAHDGANIQAQGAVITAQVDRRGIRTGDLAERVALRDLRARSTPLARMTLHADRTLWDYAQGDVLRLQWPEPGLEDMVVRVLKIRKGTPTSSEITAEVIEDIFALSGEAYLGHAETPDQPTRPPVEPDDDEEAGVPPVDGLGGVAPPTEPNPGDRYVVPAGAEGAWTGQGGRIAQWSSDLGAWEFFDPPNGAIIWVEAEQQHYYYNPVDGAWLPLAGGSTAAASGYGTDKSYLWHVKGKLPRNAPASAAIQERVWAHRVRGAGVIADIFRTLSPGTALITRHDAVSGEHLLPGWTVGFSDYHYRDGDRFFYTVGYQMSGAAPLANSFRVSKLDLLTGALAAEYAINNPADQPATWFRGIARIGDEILVSEREGSSTYIRTLDADDLSHLGFVTVAGSRHPDVLMAHDTELWGLDTEANTAFRISTADGSVDRVFSLAHAAGRDAELWFNTRYSRLQMFVWHAGNPGTLSLYETRAADFGAEYRTWEWLGGGTAAPAYLQRDAGRNFGTASGDLQPVDLLSIGSAEGLGDPPGSEIRVLRLGAVNGGTPSFGVNYLEFVPRSSVSANTAGFWRSPAIPAFDRLDVETDVGSLDPDAAWVVIHDDTTGKTRRVSLADLTELINPS